MNHPGGGYKVNLLKKAMEKYKDEDDTIVMFTDSYDVIFLADKEEILNNFRSTGANFIISKFFFIFLIFRTLGNVPDCCANILFTNTHPRPGMPDKPLFRC